MASKRFQGIITGIKSKVGNDSVGIYDQAFPLSETDEYFGTPVHSRTTMTIPSCPHKTYFDSEEEPNRSNRSQPGSLPFIHPQASRYPPFLGEIQFVALHNAVSPLSILPNPLWLTNENSSGRSDLSIVEKNKFQDKICYLDEPSPDFGVKPLNPVKQPSRSGLPSIVQIPNRLNETSPPSLPSSPCSPCISPLSIVPSSSTTSPLSPSPPLPDPSPTHHAPRYPPPHLSLSFSFSPSSTLFPPSSTPLTPTNTNGGGHSSSPLPSPNSSIIPKSTSSSVPFPPSVSPIQLPTPIHNPPVRAPVKISRISPTNFDTPSASQPPSHVQGRARSVSTSEDSVSQIPWKHPLDNHVRARQSSDPHLKIQPKNYNQTKFTSPASPSFPKPLNYRRTLTPTHHHDVNKFSSPTSVRPTTFTTHSPPSLQTPQQVISSSPILLSSSEVQTRKDPIRTSPVPCTSASKSDDFHDIVHSKSDTSITSCRTTPSFHSTTTLHSSSHHHQRFNSIGTSEFPQHPSASSTTTTTTTTTTSPSPSFSTNQMTHLPSATFPTSTGPSRPMQQQNSLPTLIVQPRRKSSLSPLQTLASPQISQPQPLYPPSPIPSPQISQPQPLYPPSPIHSPQISQPQPLLATPPLPQIQLPQHKTFQPQQLIQQAIQQPIQQQPSILQQQQQQSLIPQQQPRSPLPQQYLSHQPSSGPTNFDSQHHSQHKPFFFPPQRQTHNPHFQVNTPIPLSSSQK